MLLLLISVGLISSGWSMPQLQRFGQQSYQQNQAQVQYQTQQRYQQMQQQYQTQQQSGSSQSVNNAAPIPIVSQSESIGVDGSFNFSYETGNGIQVQQGGYLKQSDGARGADGSKSSAGIQVITGVVSYKAPDGTDISLRYIADENGFHPEGAHLPTPPPIPQEIQRALSLLPKGGQQRSIDDSDTAQESASNLDEQTANILSR